MVEKYSARLHVGIYNSNIPTWNLAWSFSTIDFYGPSSFSDFNGIPTNEEITYPYFSQRRLQKTPMHKSWRRWSAGPLAIKFFKLSTLFGLRKIFGTLTLTHLWRAFKWFVFYCWLDWVYYLYMHATRNSYGHWAWILRLCMRGHCGNQVSVVHGPWRRIVCVFEALDIPEPEMKRVKRVKALNAKWQMLPTHYNKYLLKKTVIISFADFAEPFTFSGSLTTTILAQIDDPSSKPLQQ